MKIGVNYRNWGPYATRENLLACARIADESTLDSIWVNDHIAFPPPGTWSSNLPVPEQMGQIVDPFAVMVFLGAVTSRIHFGSAVVVLPYRPAKWLQSIQVLSGERMLFGVGAGYFPEEFTALGVPRSQRGQITDETLDLLHKAFSGDPVECNGQAIVFAPQTQRPPFLIGGATEVAIPRAIARGDGWMPIGISPHDLKPLIGDFQQRAADAGRGPLEVVIMKTLPLDNLNEAVALAQAYRDAGATHLVHTQSYDTPDEYRAFVDVVSREIRPAVQ